jgi:DNA modification methylase
MREFLKTQYGAIVCGDSRHVIPTMEAESVDLIFTSPPYALVDKKAYGNPDSHEYIDWFLQFIPEFKRVLKPTGSIVINTGGAWAPNSPTKSLYQWRLLLRLVDEYKLFLAQDFYWFIPGRLTTTEYATRRKIRVRDAVEHVWWLSKTENPKADVSRVLISYTEGFKKFLREDLSTRLLVNRESYSGLQISGKNIKDNGGRIPYNMLYISAASGGQDPYFKRCEEAGLTPHPARFPKELPLFFISLLTDPGDTVLDPFGGSCTTGQVAEQLKRKWVCIELDMNYVRGGVLRFRDKLEEPPEQTTGGIFE